MVTIIAWTTFIVAFPLNLIFWFYFFKMKLEGHPVMANKMGRGDILWFIAVLASVLIPGIYLFGIW